MSAQNIANIGIQAVETTSTEKVYNFYVWDYENIVASQFSMTYDGAKMTYKEIRNSQVIGLSGSSFSNPLPGVILSSWIELDLEAESYIDSTVLYQIVFDIIVPGGSNLCFSDTPLRYEFVNEEEVLNQIIIHDDCNTGLLLVLDPTGIADQEEEVIESPLKYVFLSTQGELIFSLSNDQVLHFSLYDNLGREITQIPSQSFTTGRNTIHFRRTIPTGIYTLQVRSGDDVIGVNSVFAR